MRMWMDQDGDTCVERHDVSLEDIHRGIFLGSSSLKKGAPKEERPPGRPQMSGRKVGF
jgi:hypothetical protein